MFQQILTAESLNLLTATLHTKRVMILTTQPQLICWRSLQTIQHCSSARGLYPARDKLGMWVQKTTICLRFTAYGTCSRGDSFGGDRCGL